MKDSINGFEVEFIDEPVSRHVVAWEQAARAEKNNTAKPLMNQIMAELRGVSVVDANSDTLIKAFRTIANLMDAAITVLNDNETLTLSADYNIVVKAAVKAGWIMSPEISPQDVDNMQQWKVNWLAQKISAIYQNAVTIPKN